MRRLNQALYTVCVSNYFLIAWQGQCNPRISKKLQARADYSSFCDSMDNRRDANPVSSIIHGDREPPQRFCRFLYELKESTQFPRKNRIPLWRGNLGTSRILARPLSQSKCSARFWKNSSQMAPFSYSKYLLFGLPVVVVAGLAALWWERKEKRRSYKEVGRVSDLFIYPVKSCKGIRVNDVKCFKEGMEYDR